MNIFGINAEIVRISREIEDAEARIDYLLELDAEEVVSEDGEVLGIDEAIEYQYRRIDELWAEFEHVDADHVSKMTGLVYVYERYKQAALDEKIQKQKHDRRKKIMENQAQRMKDLINHLQGGKGLKTDDISISYRKSKAVEYDEKFNLAKLDDKFKRVKSRQMHRRLRKHSLQEKK